MQGKKQNRGVPQEVVNAALLGCVWPVRGIEEALIVEDERLVTYGRVFIVDSAHAFIHRSPLPRLKQRCKRKAQTSKQLLGTIQSLNKRRYLSAFIADR